jgi:hypothetical protein
MKSTTHARIKNIKKSDQRINDQNKKDYGLYPFVLNNFPQNKKIKQEFKNRIAIIQ